MWESPNRLLKNSRRNCPETKATTLGIAWRPCASVG